MSFLIIKDKLRLPNNDAILPLNFVNAFRMYCIKACSVVEKIIVVDLIHYANPQVHNLHATDLTWIAKPLYSLEINSYSYD